MTKALGDIGDCYSAEFSDNFKSLHYLGSNGPWSSLLSRHIWLINGQSHRQFQCLRMPSNKNSFHHVLSFSPSQFSGEPINVKPVTGPRQLCAKRMSSNIHLNCMQGTQKSLKRNRTRPVPVTVHSFSFTDLPTSLWSSSQSIVANCEHTRTNASFNPSEVGALHVLHNCQYHPLLVSLLKMTTQ